MARITSEKQYHRYLKWSRLTPTEYLFNRVKIIVPVFTFIVLLETILVQESIGEALLGCLGGCVAGFILVYPFRNMIHKRIVDSVNKYEAILRADKNSVFHKDEFTDKIDDDGKNQEWNYKEISDFLNGVKTGGIISSSSGHTSDKNGPLTSFSFPKYGCEIHVHWKDENREELAVAHIMDINTRKRISDIVDTQTIAMLRYFSGLDNKKA